jgi:hypothetical protein
VDVTASYIELGLRLGRHIDGLVDAYYGPPELAQQVEAEELQAPATLATQAAKLRESSDDGWLHAQLVGLETVARRLAGEKIAFEDEVERCYGVRPQRTPEDVFEAAHRDLDELLPGTAPLAERYQAWREDKVVPADRFAGFMDALVVDLRERTEAFVGLPRDESIELEYVTDEPWAAYNYYLGGLRSRIAINTDVAMTPDFAAELAAHEAYPGHHTEQVTKEQTLVRDQGRLEQSILLIGTPQALISEGIAVLGSEIMLGDDEERLTAEYVTPLGIEYDSELSKLVKKARHPIVDLVGSNAALMLHSDGASVEEARAYLMRWSLSSERRADQQISFIADPTWRAYVPTYADGYRVCRDFVDGDPQRFKRLLTEQLTPADLL